MNRWDFDCQGCHHNIGDYWSCDPRWYRCIQDKDYYKSLDDATPWVKFTHKDGELKKVGVKTTAVQFVDMSRLFKYFFDDKRTKSIWSCGFGDLKVDWEKSILKWQKSGDKERKKLEKKAKIIHHKVDGRGRGRLGYCMCEKCAKTLKYKCPVCGSALVLIPGKDHDGGQFELRDGSQKATPIQHALFKGITDDIKTITSK
jgi:hypothetical protein